MRRTANVGCRVAIGAMLLLVLSAGTALGQILPENHYKTYIVPNGPALGIPVTLIDQWVGEEVIVAVMDRFSTPAEKNGEPMFDPRRHLSWWRIDSQADLVEGFVSVQDQFGIHDWTFRGAEYLLNPALKNEPGGPPPGNHYKCYRVEHGDPLGIQVTLVDQFGFADVVVLEPKWFCNPVEKIDPTGIVWPIHDRDIHLTCYFVENPRPYNIPISFLDQFVEEQVILEDNDCLCLPAFKLGSVQTEGTSWGRLKALYEE